MFSQTLQEWVNKTWQHHLVEGKLPSFDPTQSVVPGVAGRCFYRYPGDPTRACGIGAGFPDEVYKPEWDDDNRGVSWMVTVSKELGVQGMTEGEAAFALGCLQNHHDNCAREAGSNIRLFYVLYERKLREYIAANHLEVPEGKLPTG